MEIEGLTSSISFGGDTWLRKAEFHVTLVDFEIVPRSAAAFVREGWFGVPVARDEWRLARKDDLRTIVVMVDQPGLDALYERIGAEPPPAHITLYSNDPERGIGLSTVSELEERSEPIDLSL